MELPRDLQQGLAEELRAVAPARLARAAEALSLRYRASSAAGGGPLLAGPDDALAYAAHRMPATFAALQAAWRAAQPAMPAPRSLLDVGAGTGAAAWAALAVWPTLSRLTLIERDPAMLALGCRLAARARAAALVNAEWRRQELNADWSAAPHDLVSAASGNSPSK